MGISRLPKSARCLLLHVKLGTGGRGFSLEIKSSRPNAGGDQLARLLQFSGKKTN